jgi:hypothetical protein
MPLEDRADGPVVNHVAILLPHGVVRGVEFGGGFGRLEHRHAPRQLGVDGPPEHLDRQPARCLEADHLAQGVHARVRPPAGQHAAAASGDLLDDRFEGLLDGPAARLPLPAGEVRAIVGQAEFDRSHHVVRFNS